MFNTITLKSKLFAVAALAVFAAVFAAAFGPGGHVSVQATDSQTQPEKRTINVSGEATVTATPDIAYITLGVVTEDKDAKVAQKNNADSMSKVVSQLEAEGIKDEDIKTVNFSLCPKYDYNKNTGVSNIVGYTCSNTVQATVRDISKAGAVIDAATVSGVNMSSDISFDLSNSEKYYNDALEKAVGAAKAKAEAIAGIYGITLNAPVTITENSSSAPSPVYGVMNATAVAESSTPVEAGTMDIKASVSLVYEY